MEQKSWFKQTIKIFAMKMQITLVLWEQILISQEYGAKIEYYEGKKNVGADGLSRLQRSNEALTTSHTEIYALKPVAN